MMTTITELRANLRSQASGLITAMEKTVELLGKKRTQQAKVSILAEKAKDAMMKLHREKYMTYALQVGETKDPNTGRANKDWSQMEIDVLLESDPEYVTQVGEMYKYQEELTELQTDILNLSERLQVEKTSARLVAAMLGTVGSDE